MSTRWFVTHLISEHQMASARFVEVLFIFLYDKFYERLGVRV
jgi:hypothetical protein